MSPFLLFAHHTHSFTPFDPFRALTRLLLMAEGFPAHGHAGFDTITYCIDGGFRHRDSEGCKMTYGDGEVQWMRAGRGILHEEMWDVNPNEYKKAEIFQIWINLAKSSKNEYPKAVILSKESMPVIPLGSGMTCKVICGDVRNIDEEAIIQGPGSEIAASPVTILHINIPEIGQSLVLSAGESTRQAVVYVRRGSLITPGSEEQVDLGDYAAFDTTMSKEIRLEAGERGLDCIVLMGRPLNEPVVWRGPFVQTSEADIMDKAKVFQDPSVDVYWDHNLSDEDWLLHVKKLDLQSRLNTYDS